MNQILRLGEGYALFPVKRYVLYILLISISTVLLPDNSAQAQSTSINNLGIPEGGLKIGDSIPEALWHLPLQVVNHPEGKDTITLNDYRGKLIILDFWATSCTPCVASLDKIDTLKDHFQNDVAFIPFLVYDKKEHALPFVKKRNWGLPTVVGDTVVNKQVLKRYLGGFGTAWIYKGKLPAVPYSSVFISSGIINKVLRNEPVSLTAGFGLDSLNPAKALFVPGNGETILCYERPPYARIAKQLHGMNGALSGVFFVLDLRERQPMGIFDF